MKFRQLVAELGIVGSVRKVDLKTRIITADFEYNQEDRVTLNDRTDCVIHPMFYRKLTINTSQSWIIYPFPDREEFKIVHS